MKIKKIFLGLVSLFCLSGLCGKLYALSAPNVRDRCRHLVDRCGVYKKANWRSLVCQKKNRIKSILEYFCRNRESFKEKDYTELLDIARNALGDVMNDTIDCYDRSSIICSRCYEEFVQNLATVYLTYVDLEDQRMVLKRMEDDEKFVPHAKLFLYGYGEDQYAEEKDRLELLKRKDAGRVRDEIGRCMQSVGVSVLPEDPFKSVDAQI